MILTIIECIVPVILVIAALIYRRLSYWRSNVPSPGLLFFRYTSGHSPNDLKDFCERNKAAMVQGFLVTKTDNIVGSLLGLESHIFASHPETAQIVLRDEENFPKDSTGFGDTRELLKDSLVCINGPEYKMTKDIMGPSFHYNYIKNFVPVFHLKTQDLFDFWKENGCQDIDLHPQLGHFTLDTLGLAAFDIDFNSIRGGSHNYLAAYNYLIRRNIPKTKAGLEKVRKDLSKMTQDIVAQKQLKGAQAEKDFLDRLLTEKEKLTESQIRDNVFLMFLAGHETTASALTWALSYLADYPEYQQTAREEVDRELKGATPDAENVKALNFIDYFIKESMRVRSIGTFASRIATKDVYVGKYFIPKGTKVGVSAYTIHHLEEFWPEPHKFDPYRFTEARSTGRHPFAYLPFSLGRRMCIGNNFSLLEQRIFLAMILQQFKIEKSAKSANNLYVIWQGFIPTGLRVTLVPR